MECFRNRSLSCDDLEDDAVDCVALIIVRKQIVVPPYGACSHEGGVYDDDNDDLNDGGGDCMLFADDYQRCDAVAEGRAHMPHAYIRKWQRTDVAHTCAASQLRASLLLFMVIMIASTLILMMAVRGCSLLV